MITILIAKQNSSSSKENMMNGSLASKNATTFNNEVENVWNQKYQQQLQSDKLKFEGKINDILKELGNMSIGSQDALTIFQQLAKLKPILSEIGAAVEVVDSEVYFQLYKRFRNIFKEFNSSADECTEISKQSLNGKFDPIKMEQIKNSIQNVAKQLESIQQNVYSETKRYIIWVDFKDSQENKTILLHLQNQYNTSITVKFYSNIDTFKTEFSQFLGHPLFLILSGQVANDYATNDGRLFNWLKEQWNKDKIKTRIKGIVVFTSDIGVKYTKVKFMTDPSKLVINVTDDPFEMVNNLNFLISPSKFCRIVGLEEFTHFFSKQMQNKLLSYHSKDRKSETLKQYHPDIIKLKDIFQKAENIVKTNNIKFDTDAANFSLVLQHVLDVFNKHKNEIDLASGLVRLYSLEAIPFYKLINTCLNTMNEKLIEVFFPIIDMFATAIYVYDDSAYPETITGGKKVKLYKGSSIPLENYNDLCKPNNFITLPGFSSFTHDMKIAEDFLLLNLRPDSKPCIFVYTQNMGSVQLPMRPKYISNHSSNPEEKEYMTYPCVGYRIFKITPKKYDKIDYDEIELVLH